MNDIIKELFTVWTLVLSLGFILLFFLVGLVIKRRERLKRSTAGPRIMKYLLLPTILIYLVCVIILKLPRTHFSVKVTETILIVFFISFLLNMINYLFFSEANIISKKETLPKLGRDIIHFFLVLLASTFVFSSIWDFNLGSLITALGVGSFVVGLALQEPLGNLFNGISLLMAKPFHKGDWIQLGEETGKVEEFNWRSVKIVNRNNELIIIPNNVLGKTQIKNLSRPSTIHAEMLTIGFSYADDPEKVKKVLLEIAKKTKGILESPESIPLTISYDDFSITYALKFYINDYEDLLVLEDSLMTQIYTEAIKNKLTIPFPIREVIIRDKDKNK
jgi:small-conductance mechanosensitive channel